MRLADLKGRSVAVWGTDAAARAALRAIGAGQPSRLLAVDDRAAYAEIPWEPAAAPLAGGDHAFPALVTADVVVRSPAVPADHPWGPEIRERGIALTSCSALWMADHATHTIAVTGSDLAAPLIAHLLSALGEPAVTGSPLFDLPAATRYVITLSGPECADLTDSSQVAVVAALSGAPGDQLNLLRHDPEVIVVNGADLALRDAVRGLTDANRFPPVPAGAGDSRFRVEAETVFCSDDALFPRAALGLPSADATRDLCLALAVLDGIGIDVLGRKAELAAGLDEFAP